MPPSSTLRALESPVPDANRRPLQRRSLWIPWTFVGCMLVVIAVNGIMIYYAADTFSGLDTEAYYTDGNEYNEIMQAAAASAALGWTAKAAFAPDVAGSRRLSVRITDRSGNPVSGLAVTVHLVRPVSTALDQKLALMPSPTEAGGYFADVKLPALGRWELRFSATNGATPWQQIEGVFLK